jgi:hypothetical protein
MRTCKYCGIELTGRHRLYCCDNHKRYQINRERIALVLELKNKLPELFEPGFDLSENSYIKNCLRFQGQIQAYIDTLSISEEDFFNN